MLTSAFGGTLLRRPDGSWGWSDGTPEPRVRTTPLGWWAPNFRVVNIRGRNWVEIPEQWRELYHWDQSPQVEEAVTSLVERHGERYGVYAEGRAEEEDDPRATRPGWLVPAEEWDVIMSEPAGVTWDKVHEEDILNKARHLGWTGGGRLG